MSSPVFISQISPVEHCVTVPSPCSFHSAPARQGSTGVGVGVGVGDGVGVASNSSSAAILPDSVATSEALSAMSLVLPAIATASASSADWSALPDIADVFASTADCSAFSAIAAVFCRLQAGFGRRFLAADETSRPPPWPCTLDHCGHPWGPQHGRPASKPFFAGDQNRKPASATGTQTGSGADLARGGYPSRRTWRRPGAGLKRSTDGHPKLLELMDHLGLRQ